MAIRVTQQYVDAFGPVDGNLVVGRQFIEVLHDVAAGDIEESANSAISFVQSATHEPLTQRPSQALGITDVATVALDLPVSASSTLAFTDLLTKTIPLSISHTLAFQQFWFEFNYVADRQVPENTLNLTQEVSVAGFNTVEHDLGLSQSVDVRGPIPLLATTGLYFSQAMRNSCHNMHVDQDLGLTDDARVPLPTQNVSHTLALTDLACMSFINQTINFVQTATAGKSVGVEVSHLGLTQTVTIGGTFRRTIAQDLGIDHALTYFEDTACNRKNYTPFMGEGAATTPAASITDPQFDTSPGDADRFLLYWPARGARTTTVSIRAPQFGNRDRNAYTRVSRETRGGTLVVFADPTWPKIRTMAVTVTGLLKAEVDEYQALIYAHLGQLIGITDWYGYEWEGVINNPNEPAVQDSKEKWTISFEFEGEIIDGFSPGHDLGIDGSAGDAKDPGANSELGLTQTLGGSWPTPGPNHSLGFISAASAQVVSP